MTVKPGYQTTEFWLAVLNSLMSVAAAVGLHLTVKGDIINALATLLAAIAPAIVTAVYILTRGRIKIAAAVTGPVPATSQVAHPSAV